MTPHKDTHPKVVEMMRYYYEVFDHIKGRQICDKAGIKTIDLRLSPVCLDHILGKCTAPGCTRYRVHAKGSNAEPGQVVDLCNKLRRGVDKMTRAEHSQGNDQRGGG